MVDVVVVARRRRATRAPAITPVMLVNGITSIQKTNHHEKATEKTEPQQEDDLKSQHC